MRRYLLVLVCVTLLAPGGLARATDEGSKRPNERPRISVIARGLNNPRGLAFGPDGTLYVAEAGTGGTESTSAICPELQIGPPFGHYTNGPTARIVSIGRDGRQRVVVDGLPSAQSTVPDWQGVAGLSFIGKRLFALVQGGGCSYGSAAGPKGVIEVDSKTGTWSLVADLAAYRRAHPSAVPDDDLEPEGVFYSIVASNGLLYVVDVNTGALLEVTREGRVRTVADFAARLGHITPIAIAERDGLLFVGNLHQFPIEDGASSVFVINPRTGRMKTLFSGLTAVTALAFDHRGRLYVLEMGNGQGSGFPDPEAGRVLRIDPSGSREVVATGLTFPTAMTMGPDGRLYVSNHGFDIPSQGTGEIVAIDVKP